MKTWEKFHKAAIPEYLARHYWWAYLWKVGVWFFDHQWIINLILFGKYSKLVKHCMAAVEKQEPGRVLQLTCVYGSLTPKLQGEISEDFHIADIAAIQLQTVAKKVGSGNGCYLERMNAEQLGFRDNSFDTVILFFLLHEMPADARSHVLNEIVRVLQADGRLIIVEYGELGTRHVFHRLGFFRRVLGMLEPFLPGFWNDNLQDKVRQATTQQGRRLVQYESSPLFNGFYRVVEIQLD